LFREKSEQKALTLWDNVLMHRSRNKKFYISGVTIAISFALAIVILFIQPFAFAQDSPQASVNQFYQWYLKTESIRPQFAQQKALFSPELYTQLTKAWTKKPGQDNFVDFDVFSGTQVGMAKAVVRSMSRSRGGRTADVDVDLYEGRKINGKLTQVSNTPIPVKVLLESQNNGPWRIQNLVYARTGDWSNLLCILRDINR
jgi:Protein of unknown function (DUF3828)